MNRVAAGLEVFAADPSRFVGTNEKAGLLYNTASIDANLNSARNVVMGALGARLVSLFGPQHGVNSDLQDNMVETPHAVDPVLGLPVWSLYAETRKPSPRMLEGLDVMLVDLTDVGTRVYTFIWTLYLTMQACGESSVRVVVLDRPNPIGGAAVEGNPLEMEYSSFVGLAHIPMRHGMTVGELALYFVKYCGITCDLEVVRCVEWRRSALHAVTGLPWAMPSPNMPTPETALVYPGMVLLEGTNASEGRGTTRPFELFGGPWGKSEELAIELNSLGLPGAHFRPVVFAPTFHKWSGVPVNGAFLHITDSEAFKPYLTGLAVLKTLWRLYSDDGFAWRAPPYEYEEHESPIHLLLGSRALREGLERGTPLADLERGWMESLSEWKSEREECLLY